MKGKQLMGLVFLIPIALATPIILSHGSPALAAFDPGVGIMIASNNIFQISNYSLTGTIASLSYSSDVPYILSGNWSMNVGSNNVTNFQAKISELKADGSDSQKILLTNFVSQNASHTDGSNLQIFTGSLDIIRLNQTRQNVPAIITIENFKAINIVLGYTAAGSLLASQPIYGIVDQPRVNSTTTTASTGSNFLLPEGSSTSLPANLTPSLNLPQLPNPFLR